MDIQATPEVAPPVIRREAYRPPEWLVPEITLNFALGIEETRISSTIKVKRNGQSQTLRLKGDGIAAEAVLVDGQPNNAWRMEGADLLVDLPGESHEVTITTQINPKANTQ
nr:aminopeptidase N [Novosphingobium sp.]